LNGYGQCRGTVNQEKNRDNGDAKKGEFHETCLSECMSTPTFEKRNGDMGHCAGVEVRLPKKSELEDDDEFPTSCEFYDESDLPTDTTISTDNREARNHLCWLVVGGDEGGKGCRCSKEQQCQRYCWVDWGTCDGTEKEANAEMTVDTQNQCGQFCFDDDDCQGYTFFKDLTENNCLFYSVVTGRDDNAATATKVPDKDKEWAECERRLTDDEIANWEAR